MYSPVNAFIFVWLTLNPVLITLPRTATHLPRITSLDEPIDIYSHWVDACEEANTLFGSQQLQQQAPAAQQHLGQQQQPTGSSLGDYHDGMDSAADVGGSAGGEDYHGGGGDDGGGVGDGNRGVSKRTRTKGTKGRGRELEPSDGGYDDGGGDDDGYNQLPEDEPENDEDADGHAYHQAEAAAATAAPAPKKRRLQQGGSSGKHRSKKGQQQQGTEPPHFHGKPGFRHEQAHDDIGQYHPQQQQGKGLMGSHQQPQDLQISSQEHRSLLEIEDLDHENEWHLTA